MRSAPDRCTDRYANKKGSCFTDKVEGAREGGKKREERVNVRSESEGERNETGGPRTVLIFSSFPPSVGSGGPKISLNPDARPLGLDVSKVAERRENWTLKSSGTRFQTLPGSIPVLVYRNVHLYMYRFTLIHVYTHFYTYLHPYLISTQHEDFALVASFPKKN